MARLPALPAISDIDFLVQERHPKVHLFAKLVDVPSTESLKRDFKAEIAAANKFKKELEKKSKAELQALIADAKIRLAEKEKKLADKVESERFFNQPSAFADFDLFSKFPFWWLEEAVALSFGRDPRVVNWGNIEAQVKISPFAAAFAEKREIAVRAQTIGQLSKQNIPLNFVTWAESSMFEMPAELVSKVRLQFSQPDWKSRSLVLERELSELKVKHAAELAQIKAEFERRIADVPSPRERRSLHKLILGMAIQKYGYDPTVSKSAVTQRIVDDLAREGISIDVGTVLTHLRAAAEVRNDE